MSYPMPVACFSLSAVTALWNARRKLIEHVRMVASIYDHNQYYFTWPDTERMQWSHLAKYLSEISGSETLRYFSGHAKWW